MRIPVLILLILNAWDFIVAVWNHGKVRRPQASVIGWNDTGPALLTLAGLQLLLWWGGWFK